jgi:hypothetical protein
LGWAFAEAARQRAPARTTAAIVFETSDFFIFFSFDS